MSVSPLTTMPIDIGGQDYQALANRVRAGDKKALESVAEGFESIFLTNMVKAMRQTLEPGILFGKDDSDVLGGMFDLFFGQHLAQAGGIGIGAMVKRQLANRLYHESSSSQPPTPPGPTVRPTLSRRA